MKLSDVKGERTLDVIADIIEPISNIASDKEAMALFEKKKTPKGMNSREFFLKRVGKSVPVLLKDHKDDVIQILSTIEGVTVEEYTAELNMAKLVSDVMELLTDEEFLSFLPSCAMAE